MAVWDLGENLPQGRVNVQPNNIKSNLIGGVSLLQQSVSSDHVASFLKPCKQSKLSQ